MMLLYGKEKELQYEVLSCGLLTALHPLATIIYIVVKNALRKKAWWHKVRVAIAPVCIVLALMNVSHGYWQNHNILKENEQNTKTEQETIILKELPEKDCSWYSIPMIAFHEQYYKYYYEVEDKDITYLYIE